MMRQTCGTKSGMLAHQSAGERMCGTCSYADAALRIAAEGIAERPSPADRSLIPVSPDQARINALILDAEVQAWEREHAGFNRTSLRVVRGAA